MDGVLNFEAEPFPEVLELLIERIKTVGVGSPRHLELFHFQQLVEKLNGGYVKILHALTRASGMPIVFRNFAKERKSAKNVAAWMRSNFKAPKLGPRR